MGGGEVISKSAVEIGCDDLAIFHPVPQAGPAYNLRTCCIKQPNVTESPIQSGESPAPPKRGYTHFTRS
jgi:hypothetical protein